MTVYHTGSIEIKEPDIYFGRKNADFGQGFYLSPDRDFACRWARDSAVLNEYELDLSGLDVRTFSRDKDWYLYIFNNRRGRDGITADVIKGPIANDTIFDTLGIISSGFLSPEDALRLLLIGPEYTQIVIKTPEAAGHLHWSRAERISRADEQTLRTERDSYQEAFLAELEKITG